MFTKRCFLCYSGAYSHLKDPMRKLLSSVGFDPVDVFDEPQMHTIDSVVKERLAAADAVVVLYGPSARPSSDGARMDGAQWPLVEASIAIGMQKPWILILHKGLPVPGILQSQAAPSFDFWDPNSFLENAHHVVRHLLQLRSTIDVPTPPRFRFKKAMSRRHMRDDGPELLEVYHQVVALQQCAVFGHTIDVAGDSNLKMPDPADLHAKIQLTLAPQGMTASIRYAAHDASKVDYFVDVSPPLVPGQELGYLRTFELPPSLPRTRAEIAARESAPGYPLHFGKGMYGDSWEVLYVIEEIVCSIHFPRSVDLASYGVRVFDFHTHETNIDEAARCQPLVRFKQDPWEPERILELTVPHPVMNHRYILVYEPAR